MRKVRKGLLVLISGLIIVLLAAGTAWAQSASASAPASGAAGQAGGTFIEGTVNNMRTVNPWKAIESPEYEVLALNFDLLENFDKSTLQAAPGVAESWTQSSDGMTWTFNIRPNMTWQDGQPFTADDIAWTYNKTLDCKLGNSLDYLVPEFTDSITATSPTTLEWKTKVPTSAPVRPPWVYIAPQHIWNDSSCADINKATFFEDNKLVGSGPFQLTDWNKGQDWTMTANPNYWGGAPHISQFKVVLYDNSEAMVNALKQGEIDYTNLGSVDLFNQLQAEGGANGIATHVGPAVTFGQMSFNMCDPTSPDAAPYCKNNPGTGNPALRDPAVRTAISWAIDRQTIVDKLLAGYGEPGTTVVPPFATFYHYQPTPDETIGFSIDKANQILDDALQGHRQQRHTQRSENRSGPEPPPDPAVGIRHRRPPGHLRVRVVEADRDPDDPGSGRRRQALAGLARRRLRPVHLGLGPGPGPRLHPVHVHVRSVRHLERHLLLQPAVRQALQGPADRSEPERPAEDRVPDARPAL